MERKKIIVRISPMAKVSIEAEGFVGGECKQHTAKLEELFAGKGSDVVTDYKDSYYQEQATQTEQEITW